MATPISPIRIARIVNTAVAPSAEEEQEIDFDLAVEEGVEILAVEFSVDEALAESSAATNQGAGFSQSLHVETGTIEVQNPTADGLILNSEIIAETQYICHVSDITTSGAQNASGWMAAPGTRFNFMELHGRPLLIAQNPTYVVDTDALTTLVNAFCRIHYRYVKLTREELVNQFLLRR